MTREHKPTTASSLSISDVVNRFLEYAKKTEYIGENRCIPCTVLNSVLALGFAVLLGRRSTVTALVWLLISSGAIYLRGYLVPRTPEITEQFFPDRVLKQFEHHPPVETEVELKSGPKSTDDIGELATGNGRQRRDSVDPESFLRRHEVIEPCDDQDDLCLTSKFKSEWRDTVDEYKTRPLTGAQVASVFGYVENTSYELNELNGGLILQSSADTIGQWPSQGALVADLATTVVLDNRNLGWRSLSREQQTKILRGVRIFVDTFPTTGAPVDVLEETVQSCCRSVDVIAFVCSETGERLYEQPLEE